MESLAIKKRPLMVRKNRVTNKEDKQASVEGNVERDVIRKISRVKQPYFDRIVAKIKESIF